MLWHISSPGSLPIYAEGFASPLAAAAAEDLRLPGATSLTLSLEQATATLTTWGKEDAVRAEGEEDKGGNANIIMRAVRAVRAATMARAGRGSCRRGREKRGTAKTTMMKGEEINW